MPEYQNDMIWLQNVFKLSTFCCKTEAIRVIIGTQHNANIWHICVTRKIIYDKALDMTNINIDQTVNSIHASFASWWPLQTVWTQIKLHDLIWVQSVWYFDFIPKIMFVHFFLKKSVDNKKHAKFPRMQRAIRHIPISYAMLKLDLCIISCHLCLVFKPWGYKTFFMLNSAEQEIYPAH